LQDASPHFKSNQEFFAFSRTQRQKALWNHQPSWWFSFIQKVMSAFADITVKGIV